MEIKRLNVRNGFFIYLFIFCFEKLESLLYGIALLLVLGCKRDLGLGTSDLVTLFLLIAAGFYLSACIFLGSGDFV
jgi:hypothetical protein